MINTEEVYNQVEAVTNINELEKLLSATYPPTIVLTLLQKKCDNCFHQSMHSFYEKGTVARRLCCRCYVGEGNPPADWHVYCMETVKSLKAEV